MFDSSNNVFESLEMRNVVRTADCEGLEKTVAANRLAEDNFHGSVFW